MLMQSCRQDDGVPFTVKMKLGLLLKVKFKEALSLTFKLNASNLIDCSGFQTVAFSNSVMMPLILTCSPANSLTAALFKRICFSTRF